VNTAIKPSEYANDHNYMKLCVYISMYISSNKILLSQRIISSIQLLLSQV